MFNSLPLFKSTQCGAYLQYVSGTRGVVGKVEVTIRRVSSTHSKSNRPDIEPYDHAFA